MVFIGESGGMSSFWDQVQKSFTGPAEAKGMTYTGHVQDGLWCNVHICLYGTGCFIHTLFPMILSGCEECLYEHLRERQNTRRLFHQQSTQTEKSE